MYNRFKHLNFKNLSMFNRIALTAIFIWTAHFAVDTMIGFWAVYKTMAKLDLAVAGLIAGSCAFIGEGLQIFFGSLSDRGFRKMLIIGGLTATIGSSLLAYADNYALLSLMFLCTCIGSGAFHPSAASLMGDLAPHRKSLLITFFASGGAFGLAFSQIVFSNSFYLFEGHTSLLAIPILLLSATMIIIGLKDPRVTTEENTVRKFSFSTMGNLFKQRDLLYIYLSQVFNAILFWGFIFLLPDILASREYSSWVSLGGGHLFMILGGAFMMVPAGYLADRFSSKSVVICSSTLSLILLYTFLFLPTLDDMYILPLLFALGASLGLINPVNVALGNKIVPNNPGLISAFLMGMVWCVAEAIGQCGGGLLTKLFDSDAPARATGILGVALFAGLAVAFRFPADAPATEPQLETIT